MKQKPKKYLSTPELLKIYNLHKQGDTFDAIGRDPEIMRDKTIVRDSYALLERYIRGERFTRTMVPYVAAAEIINKGEIKPNVRAGMPKVLISSDQLIKAWELMQENLGPSIIAPRSGISNGSIIYVMRRLRNRVALLPAIDPVYQENWVKALEIIRDKKKVVEEVFTPTPGRTEMTTDLLVKIWEMKQAPTRDLVIASSVGWVYKGATKRIGVILNTLEMYLSNQYEDIRNKQRMYKEAREILIKKYPLKKKGIYLYHDEEADLLQGRAAIDWDSAMQFADPEPPTPQENLNDAFKNLRKSIKEYIVTEVKAQTETKSLSEEIEEELVTVSPKDKAKSLDEVEKSPVELPLIEDGRTKGYYLEDIKKTLGPDYERFTAWYGEQEKMGGVLNGKVYVKAEDYHAFLD